MVCPFAKVCVRTFGAGRFSQACRATNKIFVETPRSRRCHKGLVVKPRNQQGREPRGDSTEVERERGKTILAANAQERMFAVTQENLRCTQVRLCQRAVLVDALYEGVRLVFAKGDLSSRSVILEASAEQPLPAGEQGGGERVALEAFVQRAVEEEGNNSRAQDTRGRTQTLLVNTKGLGDGHEPYVCRLTIFLSAAP